ncbi:MAG TPA: hypothetical protein VFU48_01580 [Nitrospira sp.]|nr:hypothetical protein [Nitrospira sp.]
MRLVSYFMFVIAISVSLVIVDRSSANAKTVEAGDSSSSWIGTGEFLELGNGEQVVNGIVKGVLIARHKDAGKLIVHSSKLSCPVRVNLNRKKDSQAIEGLCTIEAHEGKDIAFGHWKCSGSLKECQGEFTFTGGLGGWTGISGTTPFQTSIVFEVQEGKTGQAVGYAIWPNMTYSLP